MRLGGNARYLTTVNSRDELSEAARWAKDKSVPMVVIGDGTNIVWKDEGFNGLVIVNNITGVEVFKEDDDNVYITAGAGEEWDSIVDKFTQLGYSGIEALSLIPGKVGATPIQNVGAYGQEIANTLTTVEAYDTQAGTLVNIPNTDCSFGYRTSRFKTTDKGRFLITAVTLHLTNQLPSPPFYSSVQEYIEANHIANVTPQVIRTAVIQIRTNKLPDPKKVANCGSFFENPIVSSDKLKDLQSTYQNIPYWPLENDKVKLSAAWLVESAGFGNKSDMQTGMSTWPGQSLVIVNEHAKSTADLIKYVNQICADVKSKFEVDLRQEPELKP